MGGQLLGHLLNRFTESTWTEGKEGAGSQEECLCARKAEKAATIISDGELAND